MTVPQNAEGVRRETLPLETERLPGSFGEHMSTPASMRTSIRPESKSAALFAHPPQRCAQTRSSPLQKLKKHVLREVFVSDGHVIFVSCTKGFPKG